MGSKKGHSRRVEKRFDRTADKPLTEDVTDTLPPPPPPKPRKGGKKK